MTDHARRGMHVAHPPKQEWVFQNKEQARDYEFWLRTRLELLFPRLRNCRSMDMTYMEICCQELIKNSVGSYRFDSNDPRVARLFGEGMLEKFARREKPEEMDAEGGDGYGYFLKANREGGFDVYKKIEPNFPVTVTLERRGDSLFCQVKQQKPFAAPEKIELPDNGKRGSLTQGGVGFALVKSIVKTLTIDGGNGTSSFEYELLPKRKIGGARAAFRAEPMKEGATTS